MQLEYIIIERDGAVGLITMNRPEARNALNLQHVKELIYAIDLIENDSSIKAVILTGGLKYFCSGFDLKLINETESGSNVSPMHIVDQIRTFENKLEASSRPVIAAIGGPCLAGGFEIAISCDLRICSETSIFGVPEIRFGALAIGGATQRLPRLIPVGLAKQMHFLGEPITASEAYRIGLVNKVVPPESLIAEAKEFAYKLADRSTAAMKLCKFLINTGMRMDVNTAMEYEKALSRDLLDTTDFRKAKKSAAEKEDVYRRIFGEPAGNK